MLYAQIIALVVAIPLGVLTAYRAGTKTDRAINAGAFALLALPSFVLALALAYFVGVKWQPDIPVARPDPRQRVRAGLAGRRCSGSPPATSASTSPRCCSRRSRSPPA